MKLLSWNLNGRRLVARDQVAAVVRRRQDLVAFEEVTEGTVDKYGLAHGFRETIAKIEPLPVLLVAGGFYGNA